jgi:hypothetical protein
MSEPGARGHRRAPSAKAGQAGHDEHAEHDEQDERAERLALYRARVASYPEVPEGYAEGWSAWCRWLLRHGGSLVMPPLSPEADLEMLLAESVVTDGTAGLVRGERNACHANVARLWARGSIEAIGTGYALCGGLWEAHSWGIAGDGRRIETTVRREAYAGISLSGDDALAFALANDLEGVLAALRGGGPRARALLAALDGRHEAARTS